MKSLHPSDGRHKLIPRVHYRMVLKGAGFRLSDLKGTRELLSGTYGAYTGTTVIHHPRYSSHQSTADHTTLQP